MTKAQVEFANEKAAAREELDLYLAQISQPSDTVNDIINTALAEIDASEATAALDSIVEDAKRQIGIQLDREYAESQINAVLEDAPSEKVQAIIDDALNSLTGESSLEDIIATAIIMINVQLAVEETETQLNAYVTSPSAAVQTIIDDALNSIDKYNYADIDEIVASAMNQIDVQLDREYAATELLNYLNKLKADNEYSEESRAQLDAYYISGLLSIESAATHADIFQSLENAKLQLESVKKEIINLWWLIILLAAALIAEIVSILLIRRKKANKETLYSFSGLSLAIIIPNFAYLIISLLAVGVLALGAYIAYLLFYKDKADKKLPAKKDMKPPAQFDESAKATKTNTDNDSAKATKTNTNNDTAKATKTNTDNDT